MSKQTRMQKLAKNSSLGVLTFVITTLAGLLIRPISIAVFGYELLGMQGVLLSLIGMLSIVELGIGGAIVYGLYKPLAEGDEKKVTLLLHLYKKIFYTIGLVILVIGLALLPLLPFLISEFTFSEIVLPYLIFLIGSVLSYFFV